MAYGVKKLSSIPCAEYSDGLNTVDKAVDVGKRYLGRDRGHLMNGWRQCIDCRDVMLHNSKRRPAVKAINYAVAASITGLVPYLQYDGTDLLVTFHSGKAYTTHKTTGALTERYDFGAGGEGWGYPYLDKLWMCIEGVGLGKLENTTGYQVGITAPSSVAVQAKAGGSLLDGVWTVYAGYARRVGGVNVLYSAGEALGDVTLGSGNNTLEFTSFPNSADGQVGNKVVWATNGTTDNGTIYFYYGTNDNTTTAFDVTDATAKSTALVYPVQTASSDVPGKAESIAVLDKRLWYSIDNVVYYSLQAANVYDLEKFNTTTQKIEFPHHIETMFTLGRDLYVSTAAGIYRQPDGDPAARFIQVTQRPQEYFPRKYARTIAHWSNMVIGLTPDGVRLFDGEKMYTQDLTRSIKTDINRLYAGYTTSYPPCGVVNRRDTRTEYILGYFDSDVSSSVSNRRLVLNLDKLAIVDQSLARAPWERWTCGATYMCVDNSDTFFGAQRDSSASTIYKERSDRMLDENVYIANDNRSDVLEAAKVPTLLMRSGYYLPSLSGYCNWRQIRTMAQFLKDWYVRVQRIDQDAADSTQTFSPDASGGFFQLDVSRLGTGILSPNVPVPKKAGLPASLKGYAVYVEVTQTLEDRDWELLDLELLYTMKRSRFS